MKRISPAKATKSFSQAGSKKTVKVRVSSGQQSYTAKASNKPK